MDRPVRPEAARAAGFTLIELLVVMLIVAMVSSVVVLNMPPPVTDEKTEAEAFAARLAAAAERAIMTGTTIGLELEPGAYRFYRFERGEWRPLNDRR
ncbi:MAG: prepilin-type N-terminal cleavage/methylation domain-containing protein, partial [Hyphococcus sp.]